MIRIAILGCGTVGRIHADAICAVDGAIVYGFCDHTLEKAREFAALYHGHAYESYEALLADPAADAVAICTPSGMHVDQAIAALHAGKHVIVEKPMALNSRDAERLCLAARDARASLHTVFQARYGKDVQRLKRVLDEGGLGRLVLCDLYMKYWRDTDYYKQSSWRGTFAMDGGGALMNQGIHGVDLMNYLLGKPRLLGAKVKTLVHDIETEDTATALVEYPSGALGVIEAATSTPPGFERRIEIHGTDGYAEIINAQLTKLTVGGEVLVDVLPTVKPGTSSDPTSLDSSAHTAQYESIVRLLRGEEALHTGAEDGYNAIRLIEEIYEASKNT